MKKKSLKRPNANAPAEVPKRARLSENRLAEILVVATEVFLANGFEAASTSEIARRSNASKATFYSRFATKEKLFYAVIEKRLTEIFSHVVHFDKNESVSNNLEQFGYNMLCRAMSKDQIALIRLVNGESLKHPELAQTFYRLGPERAERGLSAYLADCQKAGHLMQASSLTMARDFMALMTSGHARWFVLQFDPKKLSEKTVRRHVKQSVEVFLRAYRAQ